MLKAKPKQDRPQPLARPRKGRFCELCGRAQGGKHRPYCAYCTDMFDLHRGECIYSEDTGELLLRSDGQGTLRNPVWEDEPSSDYEAVDRAAPSFGASWWVFIIGSFILNGCLRLLR